MSEDINRPADANDLLKKMRAITADLWRESPDVTAEPKPKAEKPARVVVKRLEIGIDNLWMTADETIDWTDALAHEFPADGLTSVRLWSFYHKQAEAVLSGDTRAYAEVLKKSNPLGELTTFAEGISMRAPDPDRVEAQFNVREEYMEKKTLSGMTLAELENVAYELGMPKYASKQIATWLYTKQIFSISEMSNISKAFPAICYSKNTPVCVSTYGKVSYGTVRTFARP